jgi:hypothetical protein
MSAQSATGLVKGLSGRQMHDMQQFRITEHLFTQAGDNKFKEIREKLKTRVKTRGLVVSVITQRIA